jgi:general secretion pathway protein D
MKLTPKINAEGSVTLEIDIEIEDLLSISPTMGPTTSKRAITTTVITKDGESAVIGGLIKTVETKDNSQIPYLGEIPGLGNLLGSESNRAERTNMMVIITPYVIRDQEDLQKLYRQKLEEQREFMDMHYGRRDFYQTPLNYERKFGLIETIRQTAKRREMRSLNED